MARTRSVLFPALGEVFPDLRTAGPRFDTPEMLAVLVPAPLVTRILVQFTDCIPVVGRFADVLAHGNSVLTPNT